jgi:hypothetical protein
MTRRRAATAHHALLLLLAACIAGCSREFEGGGELRAQRVVLERETAGLREVVQRLERGESMLSATDVAIAIDEDLVREFVRAQLPFELDVDRFHLQITDADVQFRGSPLLRLSGRVRALDQSGLTAQVTLLGALADLQIDASSSTLRTQAAIDHVTIEQVSGLAEYLDGATIDEVARQVRLQIRDRLPSFEIPVKVQREIDFPAITDGPLRFPGASMPLEAAVSQVVAARGRLWVSVRVSPGAFATRAPAMPAPRPAPASRAAPTRKDGRP